MIKKYISLIIIMMMVLGNMPMSYALGPLPGENEVIPSGVGGTNGPQAVNLVEQIQSKKLLLADKDSFIQMLKTTGVTFDPANVKENGADPGVFQVAVTDKGQRYIVIGAKGSNLQIVKSGEEVELNPKAKRTQLLSYGVSPYFGDFVTQLFGDVEDITFSATKRGKELHVYKDSKKFSFRVMRADFISLNGKGIKFSLNNKMLDYGHIKCKMGNNWGVTKYNVATQSIVDPFDTKIFEQEKIKVMKSAVDRLESFYDVDTLGKIKKDFPSTTILKATVENKSGEIVTKIVDRESGTTFIIPKNQDKPHFVILSDGTQFILTVEEMTQNIKDYPQAGVKIIKVQKNVVRGDVISKETTFIRIQGKNITTHLQKDLVSSKTSSRLISFFGKKVNLSKPELVPEGAKIIMTTPNGEKHAIIIANANDKKLNTKLIKLETKIGQHFLGEVYLNMAPGGNAVSIDKVFATQTQNIDGEEVFIKVQGWLKRNVNLEIKYYSGADKLEVSRVFLIHRFKDGNIDVYPQYWMIPSAVESKLREWLVPVVSNRNTDERTRFSLWSNRIKIVNPHPIAEGGLQFTIMDSSLSGTGLREEKEGYQVTIKRKTPLQVVNSQNNSMQGLSLSDVVVEIKIGDKVVIPELRSIVQRRKEEGAFLASVIYAVDKNDSNKKYVLHRFNDSPGIKVFDRNEILTKAWYTESAYQYLINIAGVPEVSDVEFLEDKGQSVFVDYKNKKTSYTLVMEDDMRAVFKIQDMENMQQDYMMHDKKGFLKSRETGEYIYDVQGNRMKKLGSEEDVDAKGFIIKSGELVKDVGNRNLKIRAFNLEELPKTFELTVVRGGKDNHFMSQLTGKEEKGLPCADQNGGQWMVVNMNGVWVLHPFEPKPDKGKIENTPEQEQPDPLPIPNNHLTINSPTKPIVPSENDSYEKDIVMSTVYDPSTEIVYTTPKNNERLIILSSGEDGKQPSYVVGNHSGDIYGVKVVKVEETAQVKPKKYVPWWKKALRSVFSTPFLFIDAFTQGIEDITGLPIGIDIFSWVFGKILWEHKETEQWRGYNYIVHSLIHDLRKVVVSMVMSPVDIITGGTFDVTHHINHKLDDKPGSHSLAALSGEIFFGWLYQSLLSIDPKDHRPTPESWGKRVVTCFVTTYMYKYLKGKPVLQGKPEVKEQKTREEVLTVEQAENLIFKPVKHIVSSTFQYLDKKMEPIKDENGKILEIAPEKFQNPPQL